MKIHQKAYENGFSAVDNVLIMEAPYGEKSALFIIFPYLANSRDQQLNVEVSMKAFLNNDRLHQWKGLKCLNVKYHSEKTAIMLNLW